MVFPLQRKADVPAVLIPWIRAVHLQLRERFERDFPVLRLHSDRGGEFTSDLLRAFCEEHGITQSFTLPASLQQNGVAERRIGLVMEVARTSMIHAAAPNFLWPFAVRYAAHQLNLWPRVSLPETSPTLLWTGEVGDASRFRLWGARAFVRDLTADKLSARAIPCVFLGFPPDTPGWQFYDPTSRRVFASQDVTFDESVPFYRLFPYRTAPRPPPPLFLAPGPSQVDPLPAPGPTPSGVSQVDPPVPVPVEVTGDSGPAGGGPARGAVSGGAEPGGAEPEREEPGGAEPGGAESEGAEPAREGPEGAEPGGTEPEREEPGGAESGGAAPEGTATAGARSPWSGRLRLCTPLTSQQLHEWYGRRQGRAAGARGSTAGGTSADVTGARSGAGSLPAGGAEPGGAEPVREETGGAVPGGAASGGAEPESAESGGAAPAGTETAGARSPWSSRLRPRAPLSPQQLHEWYTRRQGRAAGARGSTAGGVSAVVAGAGSGAVSTGGAGVAGPGAARTGGTGAAGAGGAASVGGAAGDTEAGDPGFGGVGSGGAAAGDTEAGDPRTGGAGSGGAAAGGAGAGGSGAAGGSRAAGGAGGTGAAGAAGAGAAASIRLFFAPPSPSSLPPPDSVLCQVITLPSSTGLPLLPGSPLPAPPPYTKQLSGLAERREPASRPVSPVRPGRSGRRVPRSRQPAVPGTHLVVRLLSSAPKPVPLPSPPASSLPDVADPESDRFRAAHPTVTRLLATVVTDSSFESTATSALSVCPPSVGGECALGTDVLEDRHEDLECLAAAAPHLVAMLLAPEGDPGATDIPTPRSYAEVIAGEYSSQWQTAMDAEVASWKSTGTYVDEVPPPGANIVDGMWIFRVKRPPGSPSVFKARYVARGFSQREGVDFFQTFSPTPKMTTLRVLLHVAAQRDYELHSLDFSTAFLQGSLHEEIWLRYPSGFTGSFPPGTQWSLRRPVYGLRQAPREWHDTLRTTLAALGFAPSTADPSLFLRTDTSLPPFYILVYVDDLVFATALTEALALVKSELQKKHTCTDLGELRSYLGLQITRDRACRTITLTQSHMVQQVLQRFGFTWSSPQPTPLATGHSLSAPPSDESVESSGPYAELVGCLMYLMTCTRPDLAYPLGLLARYVAPGRHRKVHMDAAKRVLRYLCSTSGMGLVLGGRGEVVLTGHSDASWVDDQATQRSSQGYTFSLGCGSVSWRSTRSSSVLSSSCEAEIYATAMAAQELRWLTYLLTDLGERPRSPPVLYVDNKAAIALCQEHRLEHKTKHIALRYFLARELQQRGQLRLAHVATRANTADIFTKALPSGDHQRFCTLLGLVPTFPHLL
ncbi:unnamed protein product [Closterium sp. Yama58-4]|nr:unnamed protein product [Closterium sp. Yama58-4]